MTAKTRKQIPVHTAYISVFSMFMRIKILLNMGKAAATWIPAVIKGRKKTVTTWERMDA